MKTLFAFMVFAALSPVVSCFAADKSFTAFPLDIMAFDPPAVAVTGVRHVERSAGVSYRWLIGPRATIAVDLKGAARLVLSFTASNPLDGQVITVLAGGREAAKFENIPSAPRLMGFKSYEAELDMPAGPGLIEITFSRYNRRSPEDTFASEDKEGLAIIISDLTLTASTP